MGIKSRFKKHAMETQFWAYGTSNINASVAGSGGYQEFYRNLTTQDISTLAANYPDVSAAVLIGTVVVAAPILRSASQKLTPGNNALNVIDTGAALTSAGILGYTLTNDASWLTCSAASFVVGSSLLRFSQDNPFFFKAGGLGLALGGICFALSGVTNLLGTPDPVMNAKLATDAFTFLSGLYVTSAGFLTYEGGISETAIYKDKGERENTWSEQLTHPVKGHLSKLFTKYVDTPIQKINAFAKETILTYVPKQTRDNQPFMTSMWARVPWRLMAGTSALFSGDWAFAASNGGWAGGDIAIGSKDWRDDEKKLESAPVIL